MATTATETLSGVTPAAPSLRLRSQEVKNTEEYRYAHLLPHFSADRYPPLEPFEHVDPGHRALALPNPRAFLANATSIIELTPRLGTEVTGVNLAELDSSGRDQLALEVRPRPRSPLEIREYNRRFRSHAVAW